MANTYTAIATVTVGSGGAANIEFTSIPQTYTDLLIKTSLRAEVASVGWGLALEFNGVTTGYSGRVLFGAGDYVESGTTTSAYSAQLQGNISNQNVFDSSDIYIPNYTSSNAKSFSVDNVTENTQTNESFTVLFGKLWNNTAAITSIKLYSQFPSGSDIAQYSTATLYGIKNS